MKKSTKYYLALMAAAALTMSACASGPPKPSASEGSGDIARVEAAAAIAEQYLTRPTELSGVTPIEAEVPEGKVLYYISASGASHIAQFAAVEEAAELLGWEARALHNDGSAAAVQNDFQTAFRSGADGIIERFDSSISGPSLKEAAELGIPVVGIGQDRMAGEDLLAAFYRPDHVKRYGEAWASWLTADSDANAHVLYVILAGVPVYQATLDAFEEQMELQCGSTCSVETLAIPAATAPDEIPNQIATGIRRSPDVNYVVMPVNAWATGLPAALESAGVADRVTLIGANGTPATYQLIQTGQVVSDIPFPSYEGMFLAVDAFARHFAGEPQLSDVEPPIWMVTRESIPDGALEGMFPFVDGVVDQFAEVWGR